MHPTDNREHEMADPYIITVNNLDSFYGERQILHGIHLKIPRHKITVIMGVSGCGKSTLLRHLIGLKQSPPGRLLVDGEDLGTSNEAQLDAYRRRMGVLFQGGALFNSLTVEQNIATPLKVHTRLPDETIGIMAAIKLHLVGLTGFASYLPSQLSGGMRKRAGLARALSMDPEILFVDEPSSGLDPITASGLDDLILELNKALEMTIIVVTHELESAFHIADVMVVMDEGRILAAGPPDEIKNSTNERVVQFLRREADRHAADTHAYVQHLLGKGGAR